MRVIFIGGCPPKHLQNKVKEWGSPVDFAGYAFQSALLSGLDNVCREVKVLTILWVLSWPKAKKIYLKREFFSHNDGLEKIDVFVGFINFPFIKRISIAWRMYKALRKEIRKGGDIAIINYSLLSCNMLPIALLQKYFVKTCQIVPDLPEYMSENKSTAYKIGKAIDRKIINWCIKRFDCFALLSKHMKDRLPIGVKPWMILEGIFRPEDRNTIVNNNKNDSGKKIVMYSGALGLRYGVGDMVEAFSMINDNDYELWICGQGNAVSIIKEYAQKDGRIKYFGTISREEVLKMQQRATLLINPRHKTEEYTKYSFPSKTMEYLASGTPVLMSHLESIPSDYDSHLFYFDDETPLGMSRKMIQVCSVPQELLREKGEQASAFILKNKCSDVQARKLMELMIEVKQ